MRNGHLPTPTLVPTRSIELIWWTSRTSGFGSAIANGFAAAGANVIRHSRLAQSPLQRHEQNHRVTGDLTNPEDVASLFRRRAHTDAAISQSHPAHNRLGVMITAGVASTGRAVFAG